MMITLPCHVRNVIQLHQHLPPFHLPQAKESFFPHHPSSFSQSLQRRHHLWQPHPHLHPHHPPSCSASGTQVKCFEYSHKDQTNTQQNFTLKVSDQGWSEFEPPRRCKRRRHAGLRTGQMLQQHALCHPLEWRLSTLYFTFHR